MNENVLTLHLMLMQTKLRKTNTIFSESLHAHHGQHRWCGPPPPPLWVNPSCLMRRRRRQLLHSLDPARRNIQNYLHYTRDKDTRILLDSYFFLSFDFWLIVDKNWIIAMWKI
jgi:hypothetical protein